MKQVLHFSSQKRLRGALFGLVVGAALSLYVVPAHAQLEYANDPFDPAIARESWLLVGQTERAYGVPPGLLHAMSLVETGQGIRGWLMPWPYTVCINSPGTQTYKSIQAAQAGLHKYRNMGFVQYNIGINGKYYPSQNSKKAETLLGSIESAVQVNIEPKPFARRFENAAAAEAFVNRMFAGGYKNMDLGLMQINWRVHGDKLGSVRNAFNPQQNVTYAVNYLLEHRQTRDWWGSVGRYHSGTPRYANRYITKVWQMYQRVHRINQA